MAAPASPPPAAAIPVPVPASRTRSPAWRAARRTTSAAMGRSEGAIVAAYPAAVSSKRPAFGVKSGARERFARFPDGLCPVARHEALRTTFDIVNDQPAQLITSSLTLTLLMFRVFADNPQNALTFNQFTLVTDRLNRGPDFHFTIPAFT